jgi:uncharacterized protein (DUF983 family)
MVGATGITLNDSRFARLRAMLNRPNPLLMTSRALRRRCPNCGGGNLFRSWFKARENCPTCGLRLERGEEGYVVGTYMFNLVGAELVFMSTFVLVLLLTWPHPPWEVLWWTGGFFMIAAPLLFYPFAKLLFLAFDLSFRPPRPEDFSVRK